MTEAEARTKALHLGSFYGVDDGMRLTQIEKRYVEVVDAEAGAPGPVRDVTAWVARFESTDEDSPFAVGFTFDDQTGEVLRS